MKYQSVKKYMVALTLTISFILTLGFSSGSNVQAEPGYYAAQPRVVVQDRRWRRRRIMHRRFVVRHYRRHYRG